MAIRSFSRNAMTLAVGLVAAVATAAPGDILKTLNLGACGAAPQGLAFDGSVLYYTLNFNPKPEIYGVEAATGKLLPMLVVKQGGKPFAGGFGGLEWDPNRGKIWAGRGGNIYVVDPVSGEMGADVDTIDRNPILAVAYDPWSDNVWESDNVNKGNSGWCPGPIWRGLQCSRISSFLTNAGLTFDGVDMWHYTPTQVEPPTGATGILYPTDMTGKIDLTRAIDLPGIQYYDIAWDCVTFPVPVVWVASAEGCELYAVEVASRATTCLKAPERRLLRLILYDTEVAARATHLPLVEATAERVFRASQPLSYRETQAVLTDELRPLALYRMVGPADADMGNVLRMVKESNGAYMLVRE